ncbi:MAG: hypothetical protein P9X24_07595 [Candidatus Hatepunaea meridiana]|nr:hypothetical protein [Candidatus Hatepunaea meridiana]
MNINLRFGMHGDIQLIHDQKDLIDGLVIPGHILAYQAASTSVFITSMFDKYYVIDPMTFILQNPKGVHLNDKGNLRPSVGKLINLYYPPLIEKLDDLEIDSKFRPHHIDDIDEFCKNVYEFQMTIVKNESKSSKASKYLDRYKRTKPTKPKYIIPPYFRFSDLSDPWYDFTLECAKITLNLSKLPVYPVISCPARSLNTELIDRISNDYSEFKGVVIWIDNMNEIATTSDEIQKVKNLLGKLSKSEKIIEVLYGGYMLMATCKDFLHSISHGILYTQHKSYEMTPGGGGVPERYYIPKFHEFRSMSQTDLILHKHPDLICDCEVCQAIFHGNPDNIIKFRDNPDLLRQHFLTVRRRECTSLESMGVDLLKANLQKTYDDYHDSTSQLPNPDAFLSYSKMRGLEYLIEWNNGI